jgi:hypothetical protein
MHSMPEHLRDHSTSNQDLLIVGGEDHKVGQAPSAEEHYMRLEKWAQSRCGLSHVGCIVNWNPTEKSWDCPCHGSRFDIHGQVLNGPAIRSLDAVAQETFSK